MSTRMSTRTVYIQVCTHGIIAKAMHTCAREAWDYRQSDARARARTGCLPQWMTKLRRTTMVIGTNDEIAGKCSRLQSAIRMATHARAGMMLEIKQEPEYL